MTERDDTRGGSLRPLTKINSRVPPRREHTISQLQEIIDQIFAQAGGAPQRSRQILAEGRKRLQIATPSQKTSI